MKREESKPPEVAATLSLCCNIVRIGWRPAPEMHTMLCRDRHGGELGDTYYLSDSGMCWTEDGNIRLRSADAPIHEAAYPFVREQFMHPPEETWRPGVRYEVDICPHTGLEHETRLADGIGSVILEEIARCSLPGRYDERVFYRRRWRDPDGKEFGRRQLRVATARRFRKMCEGYIGGEWRIEHDETP